MIAYSLITLIGSSIAYFLYNAAFFEFAGHAFNRTIPRWKTWGLAFVANYLLFLAMSMIELSLDINWTIIAVFLVIETKVIFRVRWIDCALVSIIGAAIGLSATIVMRSTCAIVLDVSLAAFSNTTNSSKALPVVLGFLLAAICLRAIDISNNRQALAVIRLDWKICLILLVELTLCYLYLCTNLLLYYADLNDLVLKLWSIKTALFVSVGGAGTIWLSYRMASTLVQAKRRKALEQEIAAGEQANEELQKQAEQDPLTTCYTRSYAEHTVERYLHDGLPFTVVFADLDGLKNVNDRFGHNMGDSFIAAAASALKETRASANDFVARYGGDEFLIVLTGTVAPDDLSERMLTMSKRLRETGARDRFPFAPSVTWGATLARPNDTLASLVARADQIMYRRKHVGR